MSKYLGDVSAYAYAVSKGYTGTEEEFAELMASYAHVAEDAAQSAEAAATSEQNAATYSQAAVDKALEASGYATTAADKAREAGTSASNANESASTASQKASDAAASATAAARSATDAAGSATNAANSATAAANSALAAGTAKTDAETAQGKAETAQEAAEAAKDAAEAAARRAEDTLDSYAHVDGYYDEMAVGSAEQLISTVLTEDQVPYNFRTSGGSADIGNRETDMVVGGTVAWNQLAPSLSSFSGQNATIAVSDGVATLTASGSVAYVGLAISGSSVTFPIDGHKYLMTAKINSPYDGYIYFAFGNSIAFNDSIAKNVWSEKSRILTRVSPTGQYIQLRVTGSFAEGDVVSIKDLMVIDLTQMFGSTIADYLYTLESAEAGAGVAFFRKLFPKDYYEYNPGELMSVKTSAHEMVGFNQWDEETRNGYYNTEGEFLPSDLYVANKNMIPVVPNTTYNFHFGTKNGGRICLYDAGRNFVNSIVGIAGVTDYPLSVPSNVHYINFDMTSAYGTTYKNDICINLSWSGYRNGEYEPYEKHSYALDDSLELRGIPKLSADNELYYDGDTYESNGTVTRKYGIVDLGTLTWNDAATGSTEGRSVITTEAPCKGATSGIVPNMICANYITEKADSLYTGTVGVGVGPTGRIRVFDTQFLNLSNAEVKNLLSGVYLVYELATPTTETAEPYTNPQIVNDFGTEEYVDYAYEQGLRDVKIPVGHVTEYQANLRDKLQHLPDLADSDGNYLIQQTGNQMTLVRFRIPQAPTTDGTYTLKATVSGGTPTYVWVDDSATPEEADT